MAPTTPEDLLFVGTHGWVAALHKFSGAELWRTSLPGTGWNVVSLLHEDGVLFAASGGQVFALNPLTGEIAWKNELKGLGSSHVCLATVRQSPPSGAMPLPQIAQAKAETAATHGATNV